VKQSYEQRKLLEQASSHYEKSIQLAENYLNSRGLSLADAKRHQLGVVASPVVGHEMYEGRLSIPYITPSGIVDLRFRAINHEEPKYLSLPNSTTRLYNVKAFFEATSWICVCEGEIDTITLTKLGYPAVGIPGVKNIKNHHYRILADFEKVYVRACYLLLSNLDRLFLEPYFSFFLFIINLIQTRLNNQLLVITAGSQLAMPGYIITKIAKTINNIQYGTDP
jgi:hypothetical protein